jgi:hypothetical protein
VICKSAERGGAEVAVGVGLIGGGFVVAVGGGKYMSVFVGTGVFVGELLITGRLVLVWVTAGVFVRVGGGRRVEKEAPGVRNTSNHGGLVRIDGSSGSRKLTCAFVRKSPSGLRFDPMLEFSLQLGAKRNAHPLERMMQMNPNSRISNMSRMESRLSFSRSRVFMEASIY